MTVWMMTTHDPTATLIRRARPDEATLLSDLAFRSKGYWPYDADFLEACRAELTLSADFVAEAPVYVLERHGHVLGFYALRRGGPRDGEDELEDLFLEPGAIGAGLGARLWHHALATARGRGATTLLIQADPYAEGFYRAMGARWIGTTPSGSIPGRELPLLRHDLFSGDDSPPAPEP